MVIKTVAYPKETTEYLYKQDRNSTFEELKDIILNIPKNELLVRNDILRTFLFLFWV